MNDVRAHSAGYRRNRDQRTWRQRRTRFDQNWAPLIPQLVQAYLRWKYGRTPGTDEFAIPAEQSEYDFDIKVIDISAKKHVAHIKRSGDQTTAMALVLHGYLGSSPITPSFAISLDTLELFRCIKLFKASFSTEAFAKLLCYLYYIPYRRYYRTAIADAFDIYLTILREVQKSVMAKLGRDGPDWRAVNACPPCAYKLEEEESTVFDRMLCIDGNNSLKRLATAEGRSAGDQRQFKSDYFLSRDFVAKFANEVKARQQQSKPDLMDTSARDEMDSEELDHGPFSNSDEGDPTDGTAADSASAPCATNWKAAASESNKRMWGIFEETGVFACCCRHGIMLWLVDMVRSGELAKYPLAIVAKILDVIGGKNAVGYDIGCTFEKTVENSSLGTAFAESGSRFCVNAFHGYSHAYHCQVRFHPNCIEGIGLEDLETLERVFGDSNELGPVTRYATPYRRHVLIDMFFHQRDAEKYANLGLMIYNNYVQALDIIQDKTALVEETKAALGYTDASLRAFIKEESTYFTTWKDEDPANVHLIAYVEALQGLRKTTYVSRRFYDQAGDRAPGTTLSFLPPRSGPTDYTADLSATRKLETRRRYLRERVEQLTAEVNAMEVRLDIASRWQPGDSNYREVIKYISERRYHRALGKLQRLVIQRLFELHKLNLSRTGYKARTHIAKSLQTRCKAIRNAVNVYNQAARELDPPRETLDWSKASHYAFLEEFALLRDTSKDIREKDWAKPVVRETMRIMQRIDRAHEELRNANRDIRRLHTWIRDEEVLFAAVLEDLEKRGDPLFGAAQHYIRHRRAANARNLAYIERTYALTGFTGTRAPGVHAGAPLVPPSYLESLVTTESAAVTQDDAEAQDPMDDDEVGGEVNAIMEYLADITL
ncbi:uncharacterized protein TRAVEDRAFT_127597 [Trametes versicolor FP-101664 SS1]|uniref:uncharacterized protein n=1 Tax=Trametes versicolor (strain FP-101664) TaxID=717944 RepID=UPI0004624731|nr:uncharacterized protein TRAVEDRAFT_127597 [Trametes versicolor FP-101664 SS1]EIW56750.1 hypothetical protein TRAVEDRAFT_127597 [Trametes versicolor FP-101664 SS1]